jgi:hypothetical protein
MGSDFAKLIVIASREAQAMSDRLVAATYFNAFSSSIGVRLVRF